MKAITLLVAVLLACTINACKNCDECVKYPEPDITLCKKDFASDESYDAAYRYTISQGYDCSRH
jgi:hypothetical protein